ncbi:aminotransferase [Syntrophotalea acetylenivorans]|uniref:Aminotransferase n=1 Tax=Syntrophotalea acetylenivorans TaxID=1842532 RepID=A0A1L3GLW9_9BACT|nr:DegT/DnrJ/EryC1/StrS aminotransferase family protein [Syntrophotalea acetylenivorans]APG26927.1 aminotransferase [Syntrophotalea acetylenivorans]
MLRNHNGKIPPLSPWPIFSEEAIEKVSAVLRSGKVNYWTGQECRLFENEFAEYVGTRYAIAVANGSVALELALYALGIEPGDEVVTTCRSFIATASSIVMRGARPVFADIDPVSQNINAETISRVLTSRTKAIIVVHLAGWPCEMDPILALAKQHGIPVIEDCAQAHGATYKGRMVGSLGDIAAFSFCQDKIMTTGGEGGMITLNDENLWQRAWAYKDHGRSYDAVYNRQHPPGFRWLHESFGTNWRMTEMQGVLGRWALTQLDDWVTVRRNNARLLSELFGRIEAVRIEEPPEYMRHSYYKYYAFLKPNRMAPDIGREQILQALTDRGVPVFTGSCSEIYLEKSFQRGGFSSEPRLPVARKVGETSLMFLVHPTIKETEMAAISSCIEEVFTDAG